MKEYIVPIYDDSPDHDEIFVGYIRENATEIVRCKDCAKSRPDGDYESVWLWCRRVHGLTRKNDFCPYGERRCENV